MESMGNRWYIASCVFTAQFPELSARIQRCVAERYGIPTVRCCVKRYKIREFEERMPEGPLREAWAALPDSADFAPGDEVFSLCHNCNNIIEETHPGVAVRSLWELIDGDADFPLPDYSGLTATVQDCWRARERAGEQLAVRTLLWKMHVHFVEAPGNGVGTEFCGASLYRPQPPRNPKLAPKHYVEAARGKFEPHTPEEQARIMREHCRRYATDTVICYCHYCLEGLRMGGVDGRHIAQMIFPE